MLKARSPWQVTKAVWHAMFMRELVARTMADRMAWFWMIAEPIIIIMLMLFVRSLIMNADGMVMNAEFIPWMIVGLLGFFLFRENMMRSLGAINASASMFAYRQVKPIDAVIVRCFLELALKSFIFLLFILGASLLQIPLVPDLPLEALFSWISLWLLGLGIGLIVSVFATLVNELAIITRFIAFPLLLISGVIFPISVMPHYLHSFILFNPIVHGLETLRMAFFQNYVSLTGISLLYLWYWSLSSVLLGLILHKHFEVRLKAQ